MAKIKIKQVKSGIGCPQRQKGTLRALGFTGMHQIVEVEGTVQVLGMISKVAHLVEVQK